MLGRPGRSDPPLNVILMAISLALAAFLGAAAGLVWQSSGLGDEDAAEQANSGTGNGEEGNGEAG